MKTNSIDCFLELKTEEEKGNKSSEKENVRQS